MFCHLIYYHIGSEETRGTWWRDFPPSHLAVLAPVLFNNIFFDHYMAIILQYIYIYIVFLSLKYCHIILCLESMAIIIEMAVLEPLFLIMILNSQIIVN